LAFTIDCTSERDSSVAVDETRGGGVDCRRTSSYGSDTQRWESGHDAWDWDGRTLFGYVAAL